MNLLLQLLVNGIINASIYCLLSVGFGILYRSMRFFNITLGAVYILASYTVFASLKWAGFPLGVSIAIGIAAACFFGVITDRVVFYPLEKKGAGGGVLLIASLGIYILIVNLIALVFGNEVKILSKGIEPSFSIAHIIIIRMQAIQFLAGWAIVIILWIVIRKNTLMKGIWAMGKTPALVRVLGLPYKLMRTIVFLLSSAFVGLASILVTLDVGIDPHCGMNAFLIGAVAMIAGGIDTFWGWIGGAVLIALLQSISIWKFSAEWNDLIMFGILIITLLFRPQGLFSPAKRKEEI